MNAKLSGYSAFDRFVHRVAFGVEAPRQLLLDMEERQFGARIAAQPVVEPIFVTGLPRAGTTLLLEILARHPQSACHSYRDMPFVLSPVIWQKLSRRFQVDLQSRPRLHGDGMTIDADSPEAFDEVLWLRHFPEHYTSGGIRPWGQIPPDFQNIFERHMRAVIVARQNEPDRAARYLSKNNANIARLAALRSAFPDCHLIVPLRPPLDHAMSLLRQHRAFLDRHRRDRFARRYMADLGHYEFGALHRPILFEGMAGAIAEYDPTSLDYWLAYWICAHECIARQSGHLLIEMEAFTHAKPVDALLRRVGLSQDREIAQAAKADIRPIKQYQEHETHSAQLAERARSLHENLAARATRLN